MIFFNKIAWRRVPVSPGSYSARYWSCPPTSERMRVASRAFLLELNMKKCFKCGEEKELSEFYKHKKMADGHLNKCKQCTKKDANNYQNGINRNKYLEYQRSKPKTEHSLEVTKSWSKRFPQRKLAQNAVSIAVRSGKLIKLHCFVCGKKAEAHHPDYDRPLDVIWLCPSHHKQLHAEARKTN